MSPTLTVILGTSLLGCVAGVVGSFAVLRRRALVGDALAHASLPGLCLVYLLLGERNFFWLLWGAFAAGILGVLLISFVTRWTRTKEDAAIGIVLSTFFGAGMVLLSLIQHREGAGNQAGLDQYIFGQAATMIWQDVALIAAISAVVLALVALLYKEFKVLSFDPDFAQSQGWPTLTLDLTMMGALALTTVVGLPAVGVVLMVALLIIPAVAARFWTSRLGPMLVLAGAIGLASGALGTLFSTEIPERLLGFDPLAFGDTSVGLPTGPLIVLSAAFLFFMSMLFAPQRGVLARLWSAARLRTMTARQNFLRTMYELSEPSLPNRPAVAMSDLLERRAWSAAAAAWLVRRAVRLGLVQRTAEGIRLTEQGLALSAEITRRHRLWELFLIEGANIAPDHVDRDADLVEHLLSDDIVQQLESRLAADDRLPPVTVPESPHELARTKANVEQSGD